MAHTIQLHEINDSSIVIASSTTDSKMLKAFTNIKESETLIYKLYVSNVYIDTYYNIDSAIIAYNNVNNEQ